MRRDCPEIYVGVWKWLALIAVFFTLASACSRKDDSCLYELNRQCNLSMSSPEKAGIDSLAGLLLTEARRAGNRVMEGRAHFYLSHYETGMPDSVKADRKRHLDEAVRIAEETANYTLLCYVYNQTGIWEFENLGNVATSQYWFNRSLEHARRAGRRSFGIPAEVNLSEMYRLDNDTIGLKYSHDLFDYALAHDDELPRLSTGLTLAMYYSCVVRDSAELRPYIDAMRPLQHYLPGCIELIYARYFYHKKDYGSAERYIVKANMSQYPDMPLMYAKILHATGRTEESDRYIAKASSFGNAISLHDRKELLALSAANAHMRGDDARAYEMQLRHDIFVDSVSKARNADVSRRYRIEYEVLNKDREISEQRARIRNFKAWGWGAGAIVIVIASATLLWIRRRNKMYRDIVRQNREALEREQQLISRISSRDRRITELSEPHTTKIPEEKANAIFERIQHLAQEEEIWRDPDITRERYAELAGCNRTYFSEVIKAKTGMSYSQFMNSCRIQEAIRILSDTSDDTSLKDISESLGFLSIQNFYNAFKRATGMSPDRYRRTAKEL